MTWLAISWLVAGLVVDAVVSNHRRRLETWYGPGHFAMAMLLGLPLVVLVLVLMPLVLLRRRG